MGRIDEALKRSGADRGDPAASPPEQKVFKAAWQLAPGPGDVAQDGRETPAILPVPSGQEPVGLVRFSSKWRERLAAGPGSDMALTEQFRRLAATLHHAHQTNGLRDVMLTSASPGDGKTLTAVNLALVLAESYRYRVLLIDADLRRPSIPNVIDLSDGRGLAEALIAPTEQKLALVPITSRLTVLPAGRPIANSIEALTSPRMRQILEEAVQRFDWVIVDAPPVGAATDARLLAQMVGGTLFVIHAGQSQCPDVQRSVEALGREQIIGVVLNGVEEAGVQPYYYGEAPDA